MKIKEYFSNKIAKTPKWLRGFNKGDKINIKDVLACNTFYYPGTLFDGNPIGLINNARYCNTFICIDYGVKKEELEIELKKENAFLGYNLLDLQEVKEKDLVPNGWNSHFNEVARMNNRFTMENYQYDMQYRVQKPFAVIAVYERKTKYDDLHGQDRFALLYICGEATATYDAIFCNGENHAPNVLVIKNNFGGEFNNFYNGSPMEYLARVTKTYPEYILCYENCAWEMFDRLVDVEPDIDVGIELVLYKNEIEKWTKMI